MKFHKMQQSKFGLPVTATGCTLLQTHLNQTIIALNPTSMIQTLSLLPYTGLFGTLLTLTTHILLLNIPEFSSVEKASQFGDFLRTVLDKHAPPSLQKAITHNSSSWFESIRY